MEIVIYTGVGIVLYLVTGQILALLEKLHGETLPQRNVVFFVIIMALSLSTFSLLRTFFDTGEGPQNDYQEQQTTDGGNQATQSH